MTTQAITAQKLSFTVSPSLASAISELTQETGSRDEAELFRRAIALMQVATKAKQDGDKVIIMDSKGEPKTEILV